MCLGSLPQNYFVIAHNDLFEFLAMEGTVKDALVDELKSKWQDCEDNSVDVFRYKLNVTREKVLDGAFKFFVQVGRNPS